MFNLLVFLKCKYKNNFSVLCRGSVVSADSSGPGTGVRYKSSLVMLVGTLE